MWKKKHGSGNHSTAKFSVRFLLFYLSRPCRLFHTSVNPVNISTGKIKIWQMHL